MIKLKVKISVFLKQFKTINMPLSDCPVCSAYGSTIPCTHDFKKNPYQNA